MLTRLRPRRRADLTAEIDDLVQRNQRAPDRETERRLLVLRHQQGAQLLDRADGDPQFAAPELDRLPAQRLPELSPTDLTAGLVRAAILRDGCALVRGLIPGDVARSLAEEIERAYTERQRIEAGGTAAPGYYEEFQHDPRFGPPDPRLWVAAGGGLLMVDSPILSFAVSNALAAAGVPRLVAEYLGEPGLISEQKTTLRKADPAVCGAWHQDGKFMGEVRALNLWLPLSECGVDAPGLDLVPRRLQSYAPTGTEGAPLDWTVSDSEAVKAAGDHGILRPRFQAGDALFFDELFLHKTGSDPGMSEPRYALESWFFGASKFPRDYAPLAA